MTRALFLLLLLGAVLAFGIGLSLQFPGPDAAFHIFVVLGVSSPIAAMIYVMWKERRQ